jgi:anti-anti-sigma regulatory factor
MKLSLENTPINNIIVNFKNSDYIDSLMISLIINTMKKGKNVVIKMRKGSYIEEVLITYGFINVVRIEYIL